MTEIVPFTPPSGGIDAILVALSQQDPVLPTFVYERLDPISRGPLTTWIGLRGQEEIPDPRSGAFRSLREALGHAEHLGEKALTFALIRYPGRTDSSDPDGNADPGGNAGRDRFLVAHEYLRIDHRRQEGVIVRLTEPDAPDWPRAQDWARLVETARPAMPPAQTQPEGPYRYDWSPSITVKDFARAVEGLREESGAEEHVGAVLSVRVSSTLASEPLESYRCLRAINPSTCMFLLQANEFALWGSTSLALVEIANRHLLAQTDGATVRVPDLPAGQQFEWTPTAKENYEYDVVADALREDLAPVTSPGSLRFTREREQRIFFRLAHLFAEAQGELGDGVDDVAVVEALFPHGATVGHPRKDALRLIDRLEPIARGPFSGAIGVFEAHGVTDVASVTRSIWTTPDGTFTQAGAKVVPDSIARQEYEECVIKTKAVRDSARPAQKGHRP
jgi:anthranilate synthase component 1